MQLLYYYIAKSKDAAIKSTISGLGINGSVYFDNNNGNYGGFCNNIITSNVFSSINSENKHCKASGTGWVVCARLNVPANGSRAWCADYTGTRKEIDDSSCKPSLNFCP